VRLDQRRQAVAGFAAAQHPRAQLDQIVRRRHRGDEEPLGLQHARHLARVAAPVERHDDVSAVVEERQRPVGVGDHPGQTRIVPSRDGDGGHRQIQAQPLAPERRMQLAEGMPGAAPEIGDDRGCEACGRHPAGYGLDQRAPHAEALEHGPCVHRRPGVARLRGLAVLRLQQVHIPGPRYVEAVQPRAPPRRAPSHEREPTATNRTRQRRHHQPIVLRTRRHPPAPNRTRPHLRAPVTVRLFVALSAEPDIDPHAPPKGWTVTMAKNIILCSDGTGNSDIKGRGTNVFKLFEAVDLNEHRVNPLLDQQLAFYDDGVGSKGPTLLRAMGGAAGIGLKRNVKDLYRALSRVYDEGDRIYLFGFSRGAFTVRTLAGLIGTCGIVKGESCATTHQLQQAVEAAYVAYRSRYSSVLTRSVRRLRRQPDCEEVIDCFQRDYPVHTGVPIEFIGVWDTVDAVGMPFALAGIVNQLIYQFKFPTTTLGAYVKHAYHALSIDDARLAFEPVLWTGPDDRIEQVWFAGAHSNVGGGYPKQGMSLVALDWMLGHAEAAGLRVNRMDRELFRSHASVDDMLYDPRSGMGCFYRWAPRDIRKYCQRSGIAPRIHLTVAERIAHATDDYAPGNVPPGVTVATTRVDPTDPLRSERERILGRRAEAVQAVLQQALAPGYLLDKVRMHVQIGDGAYWFMVIAWLLVVLGMLRVFATLVWPDPQALRVSGAVIAAGLTCLLCARLLTSIADHTMVGVFSQFWQQHQKDLRHTLKTAHRVARESSERLDMSFLRRRG
jgi:uncharacterized protein (DUF2235 family)